MIENNLWFFIALLSAVFWGISYCFAERIMDQGVSPAFLLLLQGIVTFPVYIIFAYFSAILAKVAAHRVARLRGPAGRLTGLVAS